MLAEIVSLFNCNGCLRHFAHEVRTINPSSSFYHERTTILMDDKRALIALQNDQFRRALGQGEIPGEAVMTAGIAALEQEQITAITIAVVNFDNFTEENDPFGEHEFGSIEITDVGTVFWKIDYYAPDRMRGSEEPSDLTQTHRVLTIMLASEY